MLLILHKIKSAKFQILIKIQDCPLILDPLQSINFEILDKIKLLTNSLSTTHKSIKLLKYFIDNLWS